VVSKYGPISRASKTVMRSTNPIQVSCSLGDNTVSTPSVRKPVPIASPMPTWYSSSQSYPVPVRPVLCDREQVVGYAHSVVVATDQVPTNAHNCDSNVIRTVETAPLWTIRETIQLSDLERMKIELHNLDCQINNLKLAAQESSRNSISEGEKLTRELKIVEKGIREKEKQLKLSQNDSWDSADSLDDWSMQSSNNKVLVNGRNDEDAYELQVAQDMQEAEQRWLHELEQAEQEWSEQRAGTADVCNLKFVRDKMI